MPTRPERQNIPINLPFDPLITYYSLLIPLHEMVSKDLNICVYPAEIIWDDIKANLDNLEVAIKTMHPKTDLLILPETVSTGFPSGKSKEEVLNLVREYQQYTVDLFKYLAHSTNTAIATSLVTEVNGELFNRAYFFEPNGDITTADKRHLFTMAGEDKVFSPGAKRLSIRYRGWNIAMIVCYDVRFPAWCRNRDNEYDLLIAVANWPEVRVDAWNSLIKARAIENLAYVAAVNCTGEDPNGFRYDGASHILDFKGKNIAVRPHSSKEWDSHDLNGNVKLSKASMLYATLSHEAIDRFRKKFPAHLDADPFRLL